MYTILRDTGTRVGYEYYCARPKKHKKWKSVGIEWLPLDDFLPDQEKNVAIF
jgi:hypothetical protein